MTLCAICGNHFTTPRYAYSVLCLSCNRQRRVENSNRRRKERKMQNSRTGNYMISDPNLPARRVALFDAMLEAADEVDRKALNDLVAHVCERIQTRAIQRGGKPPAFGVESAKELIVALCGN